MRHIIFMLILCLYKKNKSLIKDQSLFFHECICQDSKSSLWAPNIFLTIPIQLILNKVSLSMGVCGAANKFNTVWGYETWWCRHHAVFTSALHAPTVHPRLCILTPGKVLGPHQNWRNTSFFFWLSYGVRKRCLCWTTTSTTVSCSISSQAESDYRLSKRPGWQCHSVK